MLWARQKQEVLIKNTELLERHVLFIFAFPGPETWGASGHTSRDLFSSSYLYLFLNIRNKVAFREKLSSDQKQVGLPSFLTSHPD